MKKIFKMVRHGSGLTKIVFVYWYLIIAPQIHILIDVQGSKCIHKTSWQTDINQLVLNICNINMTEREHKAIWLLFHNY